MTLDSEKIDLMDLRLLSKYMNNLEYREYFLTNKGENYKLIAYISTLFNNELLLDIGTNRGNSSLAMSYNPNNKIISYDLINLLEINGHPSNIEYRLGDFTDEKYKEEIMSSPFIMLDTDHDGPFEYKAYNYLNDIEWKGYLLLDDIYLNEPMKEFWNHITKEKYDLTSMGHWSGTGLVIFN